MIQSAHWRERCVGTIAHDVAGLWMIGWSYVPVVAVLALFHRWPTIVTFLFALLVIGFRMNALFVVVHESWHYNLFRSRKLNEWVGAALAGYPIVMPYFHDRTGHWDHHRYVGTVKDPDAWAWNWTDQERGVFVRDLLALATGASYGLRIVRLLARMPPPPPSVGRPAKVSLQGAAARSEVPRIVAVHAVILAIFWSTIGWYWYFPLWAFPALSLFPAIAMLREFLEHRRGALIVYRTGAVERFLLGCFNFHLHAYHHAFASAAWFTLSVPAVRERSTRRFPDIVFLRSYFLELVAYFRGSSVAGLERLSTAAPREVMPAGDVPLGERETVANGAP